MRLGSPIQSLALGRLVVGGASLLCFSWAAYLAAGRLTGYTQFGATLMLAIPLAAGVCLGYVGVCLRSSAVGRVARELVMLAVSLLAVESLIALWAPDLASPQLVRMRVAHKLGLPFDPRTKSQVTESLRAQGVDALPGISREWPQQSAVRQQLPADLFPLSDASDASIVECNETGRYLVFRSDEFGFNNPPGLIAGRHIDVAAVGASYTLGHCLSPAQSVIGRLRKTYPRLANFGIAGSGTLAILGSFREYVEPLRPRLVLWIMHPRTADTLEELKDPILRRYLDPGFSQHLFERREEIDRTWRELDIPAQYEFDRRSRAAIQAAQDVRFRRIPFLPQLRARLQLDEPLRQAPTGPPLNTFVRALQLANATTRGWGGRMVVIIMPLYVDVVAHQLPTTLQHAHLASIIASLGIAVVDGGELFERQRDPRHLYTMRINNHPNAEGYELLANFVAAGLGQAAPQLMAGTH